MNMFASNLKRIRKNQEETQSTLAAKLGVSDKTVCSWEAGRTEPNMEMLEKIAKALNCRKTELMGWSNETPEDIVSELYETRRLLFDKSAKATPEQLQAVINLLDTMIGE